MGVGGGGGWGGWEVCFWSIKDGVTTLSLIVSQSCLVE